MPPQGRRHQRTEKNPSRPVSPSVPYDVEFSETAFSVYQDLHQKMRDAEARGQTASAHHTRFRMVEEVIKKHIPHDPLNKKYGLSGPLSQYFRIKKGRHRICWAASSQNRVVCILFISETLRKDGDANDPYNIFTKLVMSGAYHDILGKMGLAKPQTDGHAPQPPIN
jgi:mRNA-degrading endonuclease RelE of RelBE toxin-antitoxin system